MIRPLIVKAWTRECKDAKCLATNPHSHHFTWFGLFHCGVSLFDAAHSHGGFASVFQVLYSRVGEMRAFVESDVWLVAELAYTNARNKLTAGLESMPPWDEISYEKRNVMATNVLDVYNALADNGFVIMKEEN